MSIIQQSIEYCKALQYTLSEHTDQNVSFMISDMGDLAIFLHHIKKRPTTYKVTPLFNMTAQFIGTRVVTLCNETRSKNDKHLTVKATFQPEQGDELTSELLALVQQGSEGVLQDTQANFTRIGFFFAKPKKVAE